MKLTIILAGENPSSLQGDFGPYANKFKKMFLNADASFTFNEITVHAGENIPDPDQLEGVIVTGSAAGVYDDLPWMEPLRKFIRLAYEKNLAMVGICFGHQIMADALGGKVIKSPKGWGLGRHTYRLNNKVKNFPLEIFPANIDELAIAASHQDQVVIAPQKAKVFMQSDFTANAGLIYDNRRAMSMQPHPEFEKEYSAAIFGLRRGNPLTDAAVDAAVKTLDEPVDNDLVALTLAKFFTGNK